MRRKDREPFKFMGAQVFVVLVVCFAAAHAALELLQADADADEFIVTTAPFYVAFYGCRYHVLSTIPSEMKVRDFFGGDVRPLDEIAFGTSLLLVNAHFSINDPKPTVPGVVEVGGLHIGGTAEKTPNVTCNSISPNNALFN